MSKKLKIGVQMDHISSIDIKGDSTFAMCLEAQARGYDLFHFHPNDLQLRGQELDANIEAMQVRDVEGDHFRLGEKQFTDMSTLDVILLRQDPPFDMSYITNTHMLDRIHPKTVVVNDPSSVRNSPEKILVMEFPELMPATLVTRDYEAVRKFRQEFGELIVKPLYGNGGAGVFRVSKDNENLSSILEMFEGINREPIIAQQYLKDVRKGDKRIILIDGEPVGAINRVPPEGDARSNMHVGGVAEHTELTQREREICAAIGPRLKEEGFILVGIDVIGDYITEINVTSPTGLREIKNFSGTDIAALFWDAIEKRI
ncbi:MAG: glutathione synthase [Nitratireductor sp.]